MNEPQAIVFTPGQVGPALTKDGKHTVLVIDDAKLGRFLLPLDHGAAIELATEIAAVAAVGSREGEE